MASLRVVEAKPQRLWKVLVVVVAVAIGISVQGGLFKTNLSASRENDVGFVDVNRLIDDYLAPVVDGPLTAETLRLQAEFEASVVGLDDAEAEEAFGRYQAMLNLVKHDLIEAELPTINAAIGVVAEREAIGVVLDKQSVLHGGIDLTELVLSYLQETKE